MDKDTFSWSSKVFSRSSLNSSLYEMSFKDEIHGAGRVDSILGTGTLRKEFTFYFFRYLESQGIETHLDKKSDIQPTHLLVHKKHPLRIEVLVRYRARGYWVDEHKLPLFSAGYQFSTPIVEFSLKKKVETSEGVIDDPRVSDEIIIELGKGCKFDDIKGFMPNNLAEIKAIRILAQKVGNLYSEFLLKYGWNLEDFKFEIGVDPEDNKKVRTLYIIDEISPDCSRIRDSEWNSLTKDLFRQRKSSTEIYRGYKILRDAIKDIVVN